MFVAWLFEFAVWLFEFVRLRLLVWGCVMCCFCDVLRFVLGFDGVCFVSLLL